MKVRATFFQRIALILLLVTTLPVHADDAKDFFDIDGICSIFRSHTLSNVHAQAYNPNVIHKLCFT